VAGAVVNDQEHAVGVPVWLGDHHLAEPSVSPRTGSLDTVRCRGAASQ
jgi:hypothetical protein